MRHDMFQNWKPEDLPAGVPKDRYEITPTNLTGFNSGRTRFKVVCKECKKQLHEATTSPTAQIRMHEGEAHDRSGDDQSRPKPVV